MRFATAKLRTGPQIHYAETGETGGEPVVFLHGWPDSSLSFSRVTPLLPPDVHTFAIDQRGFGDSDRSETSYGIPDFAADVVSFLDAVSIGRATLVGHSFGSFVARRVAISHPERVKRLVLIGTGFSPSNAVTRDVQTSLRGLSDPISPEFAREFQSSTLYLPLPESFFEGLLAESLKLPAHLWRETFDGLLASDDEQRLSGILAPTLLIWGEHDALFPRDDQDRVVRSVKGARLIVYPETGHCPNWERPERVAADLTAFLRES
jgi:pimeloyl-ACP methyl ester carboxylesterase